MERMIMKLSKRFVCLALTLNIAVLAYAQNGKPKASDPNELPAKIRRFAPTVLTANTARLTPKDRLALRKDHRRRKAA